MFLHHSLPACAPSASLINNWLIGMTIVAAINHFKRRYQRLRCGGLLFFWNSKAGAANRDAEAQAELRKQQLEDTYWHELVLDHLTYVFEMIIVGWAISIVSIFYKMDSSHLKAMCGFKSAKIPPKPDSRRPSRLLALPRVGMTHPRRPTYSQILVVQVSSQPNRVVYRSRRMTAFWVGFWWLPRLFNKVATWVGRQIELFLIIKSDDARIYSILVINGGLELSQLISFLGIRNQSWRDPGAKINGTKPRGHISFDWITFGGLRGAQFCPSIWALFPPVACVCDYVAIWSIACSPLSHKLFSKW